MTEYGIDINKAAEILNVATRTMTRYLKEQRAFERDFVIPYKKHQNKYWLHTKTFLAFVDDINNEVMGG